MNYQERIYLMLTEEGPSDYDKRMQALKKRNLALKKVGVEDPNKRWAALLKTSHAPVHAPGADPR